MCRVVNIKNSSYDVLIMRPTKWGNPFKTGIHGDLDKVLELYENYLINNKDLMNSLHELKGKRLGCCCKPSRCHGDILAKYVIEKFGDIPIVDKNKKQSTFQRLSNKKQNS